ncbi:MAG: acylneuraminate cytidylyltransferase [Nitrosopumilaceae archaeon]|nr:acylneuraminate cytidylyltransferase [Nitrosopumilaceae archaeon]
MEYHIFLQARVGSTRLPGKILKKICGKTVFELLVERLRNVKANKIILATGSLEKNNLLVNEAKKLGIDYFCGPEENVLDRFYTCANHFQSDNIIRVTGDCPLIDYNVINKGIGIFDSNKYDILSVDRVRTFPHGFDFEIFTKDTLIKSWNEMLGHFQSKEEFSSKFMPPTINMLQSNQFNNYDLINDKNYASLRLTMDYEEDFQLINEIYGSLYAKNKSFAFDEILQLFNERPRLLDINKKFAQFT